MTGQITQAGKVFNVNQYGHIISELNPTGSPHWMVLGAVRYNNFGQVAECVGLDDLPKLNGQWQYKNGKQRWHIRDLDHGTPRVWQWPNHTATFDA